MLRGGGGGGRKKGKGNRECSRSGRGKKGKARRVKEGRKEQERGEQEGGKAGRGGGEEQERGGRRGERQEDGGGGAGERGGRGGKKQQMYNTQHPLRNMVRLLVSVTKNSDGSCLPGRMPNRYSGRPKSMSWRVKNTRFSYQKFVQ